MRTGTAAATLGHVLSLDRIEGHLTYNGWLDASKQHDEREIASAVADYQQWAGLVPDGWVGPITRKTLLPVNEGGMRFCGVPDRMFNIEAGAGLPQWPIDYAREQGISYAVVSGPPKFTLNTYKEIVDIAVSHISETCGAKVRYQSNYKTANVVMNTHNERPGNVLAYSEVPWPGITKDANLKQSYDNKENWVDGYAPQQGEIGAIHVIRHEWAHAAGVPHGKDLMAPYYDPQIYEYGEWSTRELTKRYGPVQVAPPTPPEPPPTPPPEPPFPPDGFDPTDPNRMQVLVDGRRFNLVKA